jgi:MFS family permease
MNSIRHIKRVYYLIIFLFWIATALPMALVILLAQARGMNLFQIGLLMGSYSLTIVLLEVPTGGLADAIGRKRVAIAAYSLITISSMIFVGAFSFPVLLGAFILMGAGRALSSGALDAWFVDALQTAEPTIELQPPLARAGTLTFLALGLGTLLGSVIPRWFSGLPADGTAVLTPFAMPLVFAIGIKIILVTLTILLVKEGPVAAHQTDWKQGFRMVPLIIRTGFSLSRHNPTILLLLGASLAGGLAVAGLESFWQPHFANLLGGSDGRSLYFGLIMGGNFLVGMAGNMMATPVSRWLKKRYGLVCAVFQFIWGASILLLALQTAVPLAALLFWLAYLNMGVINSPHNTLLNGEIPARQRSAMLSIASLAGYLGATVGSAGLGYMAEHSSIGAAWITGAAILVVSSGLYWLVDQRQSQKRLQTMQPVLKTAT